VVLEPSNGRCGGRSEEVVVQVLRDADAPAITVEGSTIICDGVNTLLRSDYQEGNQWLKDGWTIETATDNFLEVTEAGFYQVQITDPITGVFIFSETVEIQTTSHTSDLDFRVSNTTPTVGEQIQVELIGTPPPRFWWNFGINGTSNVEFDPTATPAFPTNPITTTQENNATPSFQYDQAGNYTISLIIENELGCQDTIQKENYVRVSPNTDLFIPTGFTPNEDGVNDFFRVRGKELPNYQLQIYNQWGEQLFASQLQEEGWNGIKNGQPVNAGTYTYVLSWKDGIEGLQYLSGHVTLLR